MLKLLIIALSLFNNTNMNLENPKPTINISEFDTSINPANNFYEFVNNKWLNKNEIPKDKSAWGNFHILAEKNEIKLRAILDSLNKKDTPLEPFEQKLNDFYTSGLNINALDKKNFDPIKQYLQQINSISSSDSLVDFVTKSYTYGLGFLFSNAVYADSENPNYNIFHLFQSGLNLPDKEYYLSDNKQKKEIRKLYKNYITKLFTLINIPEEKAEKDAQIVLDLESKIAKSHRSQVELRDPILNYNAFTIEELNKQIPNINWNQVFANMKVVTNRVIISQPDYYNNLIKLLATEPIDNWKIKLRFDLLHSSADFLSKDFRETKFELYDKIFTGAQQEPERWKKMVRLTNSLMGEAIGKLFVEKFFPSSSKEKMINLIKNLKQAYNNRIQRLNWMDKQTKEKAIEKLNTMSYKIGYPDKFKDYGSLIIEKDNFFNNILNLSKYEYFEELNKIDKPIDKNEWSMPPATVNAYYSPLHNEIVFPAGILQPPFFDFNASDAENYGAIGVIIGHEITHGFDDQGRKYDLNGKLNNWWSDKVLKNFTARTQVFVKQYNECSILNQKVNGELTLGENIADLGGLQISFEALNFCNDNTEYKNYTKEQIFFISYARMWRMKTRDAYMKLRLNIDPHSPEVFRVNIPLSNMESFYKAFNVSKGNSLYREPDKMANLW